MVPSKDPAVVRATIKRYKQSPKGRAASAIITKRYRATLTGQLQQRAADLRRKGTRSVYEHERSLRRLYGMSPDQYQTMLTAQKSRCAICESTDPGAGKRRLAVDHNHKTGKVRGLLCNRCNQALGQFFDSPVLLRKAIWYLCSANI